MEFNLSDTQLFSGISDDKIQSMLVCLKSYERHCRKGEPLFSEGFPISDVGIIVSGSIVMEFVDALGTNHILRRVRVGGSFGEEYACGARSPLLQTIRAHEDTHVIFVDARRILSPCEKACECHNRLIQNLVFVAVSRSLQLLRKVVHSSPKTIRERLISYFSEQIKWNGSYTFDLQYSRQQLADYLNVERSALCNELSKMQKDGLITYRKNHITVNSNVDL